MSAIKRGVPTVDVAAMAIAVASQRTNVKTLRLAQPAVRSSSALEMSAVASLMLAAAGVWLFVLPIELLRLAGA